MSGAQGLGSDVGALRKDCSRVCMIGFLVGYQKDLYADGFGLMSAEPSYP